MQCFFIALLALFFTTILPGTLTAAPIQNNVPEIAAPEITGAEMPPEAARTGPPPPILFGRHQSNFAWGRVQRGWFIGADGKVVLYDLPPGAQHEWREPDSDGYISRGDLETDYALATRVVLTLPPEEIKEKNKLLAALATDSRLSPEIHIGCDIGKIDVVAYCWDISHGQYKRILLYRQGDSRQTNESPPARELARWLDGINQRITAGK